MLVSGRSLHDRLRMPPRKRVGAVAARTAALEGAEPCLDGRELLRQPGEQRGEGVADGVPAAKSLLFRLFRLFAFCIVIGAFGPRISSGLGKETIIAVGSTSNKGAL